VKGFILEVLCRIRHISVEENQLVVV